MSNNPQYQPDLFSQITVPFQAVHERENNPVSQAHLEKFKGKFNGDCFKIFCELVKGRELTVAIAFTEGLSTCFPRRIKDLRDKFGVFISDKWDSTNTYKIWYMTSDDKAKSLEVVMNKAELKPVENPNKC